MTEIIKDDVTQDIPTAGTLPLLALRDVVVYPHMQIALFVGREKSINAVEVARNNNDLVFVVAQKDSLTEDIDHDNLYQYGTVARIVQVVNHENDDNCIKVLIEGLYRSRLEEIIELPDHLEAKHDPSPMLVNLSADTQTTRVQELQGLFSQYAEIGRAHV